MEEISEKWEENVGEVFVIFIDKAIFSRGFITRKGFNCSQDFLVCEGLG